MEFGRWFHDGRLRKVEACIQGVVSLTDEWTIWLLCS
jgi:hypothetical protein